MGILSEYHRRFRDAQQLGEIEDLHAVVTGKIRDDECVIVVGLDVPPMVVGIGGAGQAAQIHGLLGIGDFHKRGLVGHGHQGEFPSAGGIGPTPNIRAAAGSHNAAHMLDVEPAFHIDPVAGIGAREPVHAGMGRVCRGRRGAKTEGEQAEREGAKRERQTCNRHAIAPFDDRESKTKTNETRACPNRSRGSGTLGPAINVAILGATGIHASRGVPS